MTARVSVIVPCHNHGHLLADALDSIAAQGVANVEVVVVDDRSVDDTAAVATSRGARLLRSHAPGAGAARNAGINATTGEIVAFLDADDVWTPRSLPLRLAALEMVGDGVGGRFDAAYGAVEEFVDPSFGGQHTPREASRTRMAGSMVITRQAVMVVGPIDESLQLGEFIDWVARFDGAGLRANSIGEVVLRRRIHASNSTREASAIGSAEYLKVARMHRRRQNQ